MIRNKSVLAVNVLKIISFLLVSIVTVATISSTALSSGLVVLYPQVRQPYAKIYEDIMAGIVDTGQTITQAIAVDPNLPTEHYKNTLTRIKPDAIIALGENNVLLARDINLSVPLIAGALISSSGAITGISMVPDARVIINKLVLLYPNVRNIHVVTNTKDHKNQLTNANSYTASKAIKLIVHDASTVQEAASEYKRILAAIQPGDAIWLMRDSALQDSALLSQILKIAWNKRVAVFSANPTHVKRGALFAIYPNNKKLGASLALLASSSLPIKQPPIESSLVNPSLINQDITDTNPPSLSPLQDVYTVINRRTSRHLGISINSDVRAEIDGSF